MVRGRSKSVKFADEVRHLERGVLDDLRVEDLERVEPGWPKVTVVVRRQVGSAEHRGLGDDRIAVAGLVEDGEAHRVVGVEADVDGLAATSLVTLKKPRKREANERRRVVDQEVAAARLARGQHRRR